MEFISIMEIIGTVAFAVTGAVVAIEKNLDYYGISFLALITAVGGGIIRDIIVNDEIPVALDNPIYAIISIATGFLVILFYKKIKKINGIITYCDAIGLAAFTAIGCEVASLHNLNELFIIITLSLLTGTGGGVLRDLFAREIPFVFRKEVYAIAGLIGAIAYIISYKFLSISVSSYICFALTLIVRAASIKKNLHLKKVKI